MAIARRIDGAGPLFQVGRKLLDVLSLETAGGAAGLAGALGGGQRGFPLDLLDQIETRADVIVLAFDDQRYRPFRPPQPPEA